MPPFLRLRRSRSNDAAWTIVDDQGEDIGSTYWHAEAPPGVPAWSWSIGLYARPHQYGRAASLDEAKTAIRAAWAEMRAHITPAEYAAAQDDRRHHDEMMRAAARPNKITYVSDPATCAMAERWSEELMGCLEASAEAMELAELVTLVEDWRARVEGRPPPSSRREEGL